jgi:Protein of unknown function (DUF4245)
MGVAGVVWDRMYRQVRDVRSLVRVAGGVTTIVSGDASYAELGTLAASLR